VVLILWLVLFSYRKYLQKEVNNKTKTTEGYSFLEKIQLGGVYQWILIRGKGKVKPVILFLHGGPGAPLFPWVRDMESYTHLDNYFTMVYWEQRGTGKSYRLSIPAETMTIDQLVSDTYELIQNLCDRFQVRQVYLMARSWGTIIGIFTAQKYPDKIKAFISIGQVVFPLKNDSISYYHTLSLANQFGCQNAIKELRKIGLPPYEYKQLIKQRKWLTKFSNGREKYGLFLNLNRLLSTPEYSWSDIFIMGLDPYFSLKHLWNNTYYEINLVQNVPVLQVPVYFLVGRKDYFTPGFMTEDYFKKLIAPKGKKLIWFENSGHHPEYDEPEKLRNFILEEIFESFHPNIMN
jgi:pimeloyl-ACP methyl ester carboxylesterase